MVGIKSKLPGWLFKNPSPTPQSNFSQERETRNEFYVRSVFVSFEG
jgi:hypothetical protein